MKKLLFGLTLLASMKSFAYGVIEDGGYIGENPDTGKECKIEVLLEGDYINSQGVDYRVTIQSPNRPNSYCADFEGTKYDNCGSGAGEGTDAFLQIYGVLGNTIEKILFDNGDFDSTNDKTCINFEKL